MKGTFAAMATAIIALGLLVPRGHAVTYSIDDGTAETAVGTGALRFMALNSFAVTGGNNMVNAISVAFGTPLFPDSKLNGRSYTAVLWSDPNGDGSPIDGIVLATADGVVANESTDTFITLAIAPTMVLTPNFFVGFIIDVNPPEGIVGFDEDAPSFPNRSFVVEGGNINDLSKSTAIETFGLEGNFMIRANAVPEPCTYTLVVIGLLGLTFVRKRYEGGKKVRGRLH